MVVILIFSAEIVSAEMFSSNGVEINSSPTKLNILMLSTVLHPSKNAVSIVNCPGKIFTVLICEGKV